MSDRLRYAVISAAAFVRACSVHARAGLAAIRRRKLGTAFCCSTQLNCMLHPCFITLTCSRMQARAVIAVIEKKKGSACAFFLRHEAAYQHALSIVIHDNNVPAGLGHIGEWNGSACALCVTCSLFSKAASLSVATKTAGICPCRVCCVFDR
jgi:hypothetical protein